MKITCACGLSHYLYDYPPGDVSEGGKDMKERHVICNCGREAVIRTSPKDEPDYNDPNPDKNSVRNVVSFEELSRRLGVKPVPASVPAPAPAPAPVQTGGFSISLSSEEVETMREAVSHYGAIFKQGDKEAQEKYEQLVAKIQSNFAVEDVAEARMVKCAFAERNLRRLWPVDPLDDEDAPNAKKTNTAKALRDRLESEWKE